MDLKTEINEVLNELGIEKINTACSTGQNREKIDTQKAQKDIYTPIDGSYMASVQIPDKTDYEKVIATAQDAFIKWRKIPAPQRGQIVRQIGDELRRKKEALGKLVTLEMGKIVQEGKGEVQEMIDICDFALGQSRQLYGYTMQSEREEHRLYDQYHPLGIVGIITAFNFPVAVWAWNTMNAVICGDVCIWKPSERTPLTAIACQNIVGSVLKQNEVPEGVFNLIAGDSNIGETMSHDNRVPLISATGSIPMGKKVGAAVAARLGRTILELGGNNAIIISEYANLELAMHAVVFGAVGAAGQRCTTTRRLIVHDSVYEEVKKRLLAIYPKIKIGNPLEEGILMGPVFNEDTVNQYKNALKKVQKEGGKILYGGNVIDAFGKNYVEPAIAEAENHYEIVQEETFAPILYLIKYSGDIEEAIALQNNVKQGLSSALFSNDIQQTETYLSAWGSDCGISNINIGTSGAEIGGAFGGEKETGGGRESGSDAWKNYMRRQTNTINFSKKMPLAQGIKFDFD